MCGGNVAERPADLSRVGDKFLIWGTKLLLRWNFTTKKLLKIGTWLLLRRNFPIPGSERASKLSSQLTWSSACCAAAAAAGESERTNIFECAIKSSPPPLPPHAHNVIRWRSFYSSRLDKSECRVNEEMSCFKTSAQNGMTGEAGCFFCHCVWR